MRKFLRILLPAILLPALSYAQSNYKPGFIVDLKGDTLNGFIDYREWNSNPDAIDFKTAVTARDSKRFTPADISYFNITGLESYVRHSGPISMDATDRDHISTFRDTSFRQATVFFKVLQKGHNLTLYSYADNLKQRFYIGEAPDYAPKELVYRLYYNYSGDNTNSQKGVTVNENTYMKQLFALANKYEVLNDGTQWDIEHAAYNSDDILKIVRQINHISKADFGKTNAAHGPVYNLFISAGVNINKITSPPGSAYTMGGGTSSSSNLPEFSIGANFFANPSTRQLQFRLEAGLALSQFKSLYPLKVSPYGPFEASFDMNTFSISPQIIYNFYNAENFKVYADIGMSLLFFSYSKPYLGPQDRSPSPLDLSTNPYYFNKTDDGFLLKGGVQIHKNFGIFVQYQTSVSNTKGGYFGLTSIAEQVGLNYYFW